MKKARLNVELDGTTKKRLDRLKRRTEADSLTQVIRRALQLYELLTEHDRAGGELVLRNDRSEKTVVLL